MWECSPGRNVGRSAPGGGTSKGNDSEASVRKTEGAGVAGAQKAGEEGRTEGADGRGWKVPVDVVRTLVFNHSRVECSFGAL